MPNVPTHPNPKFYDNFNKKMIFENLGDKPPSFILVLTKYAVPSR